MSLRSTPTRSRPPGRATRSPTASPIASTPSCWPSWPAPTPTASGRSCPTADETKALRALTRAREDLVGARVELANQLRAQLEAFWPGALIFSRRRLARSRSPSWSATRARPTPRASAPSGMEAFLARHGYSRRNAPEELLARMRSAPGGTRRRARGRGAARRRARPGRAPWSRSSPRSRELTAQIREALAAHPDAAIFAPLFRDPKTAICPATLIAELGDSRGALPDRRRAGRRRRHEPGRGGVGQAAGRHLPTGLRQAPARRRRDPRQLHPPLAPLGARGLPRGLGPEARITRTRSAPWGAPGCGFSGAAGGIGCPTTRLGTATFVNFKPRGVDTGRLTGRPSARARSGRERSGRAGRRAGRRC